MNHEPDRSHAHNLRNEFQAVHLYSLRHWPEAMDHAPPESGGPYVIMQTGVDPDDPGAEVDAFILGRSGHWLSLTLFQRLSRDVRRDNYLFSMAAEAIIVLQGLTGRPVIDREPLPEGAMLAAGTVEPPDEDPLHGAIRFACAAGPTRGTAM